MTQEQIDNFTNSDWRGLCAELMEAAIAVDRARWGRPAPAPAGDVAAGVKWLRMFATGEFGSNSSHPDARQLRRISDLLEQHQAAPVPVAVSERWPEAEDCDAEGRCWWWDGEWGLVEQRFTDHCVTHWLPANALPLPSGEVQA